MRRSPSIEPFTPSPNVQLHPTLQAVLDSLDVQIEAELIRYRRQRRQPNARPRRQVRPQDPTALGILQQNIQLPRLGSSLYEATEAPIGQARDQIGNQPGGQLGSPLGSQPGGQTSSRTGGQSESRVGSPLPQSLQSGARPTAPAAHVPPSGVAVWSAAAPVAFGSTHSDSGSGSHRVLPNGVPQASPNLPSPEPAPAPVAELGPAEIASYANQYDLSAYAPNSTMQRLMHQAASAGSLRTQTVMTPPDGTVSGEVEDYLASSEELLRSIAEEARPPADREPNSLLDTLLTPLGVGSMLLLLLTSTTLGYVMMNPATVGLAGGGWAGNSSADNGSADGSSADNGSTSGSAPASQPAPTAAQTMRGPNADQTLPSPNLAADEFVDLGLDTLSTIPRAKGQRPKPATSPKPAEAKPAAQAAGATANTAGSTETTHSPVRSSEPPATVVMPTVVDSSRLPELPAKPPAQPRIETVVVPARPPITETPPAVSTNIAPVSPEPIRTAPPPIQPAPIPSAEPAPSLATAPNANPNRYYVVTDYSGDASLEAARTAVPDAYVRNLPDAGAKVQLGSFNDEAGAEGLRQQLQQQGIEAEVYRP